MILLDTQVLVWMVEGVALLGSSARKIIEQEQDLRISAMVQWELAMLHDKKRMTMRSPLDAWVAEAIAKNRFTEVPVTGAIARDAGGLRDSIHGDPCDRIMIATARALGCPLVTSDHKILDYAKAGHLRTIDARR